MNKKARIYLDTSVISYLDQTDSPEKMQQTQDVWYNVLQSNKYQIVISNIAIAEIMKCKDKEKRNKLADYLSNLEYIFYEEDEETEELANIIISEGILRPKSKDDALHIAAAILTDCDIILSWNFKHLVNIDTISGIRKICFANHFNKIIDIYSPNVLLKEGDDNNE